MATPSVDLHRDHPSVDWRRREIYRGATKECRPYKVSRDQSVEKSRVRIKLRVCHVTFADGVHCDVVDILLQIEVVSDYVIEESRLPETFLQKMSRLNVGPVLQLHHLRP